MEELADPEVSRTEVVRPGRDAVGLVDAHEGDGGQALDDLCVSKIFPFSDKVHIERSGCVYEKGCSVSW